MPAIDWSDGDKERYKLLLEVRYSSRFNELQARFYGHLRTVLRFALLVGGASSFAAYFFHGPEVQGSVALVLAIVALLDILLEPGGRSACFDAHRRRYDELDARPAN